MDEQDLHDEEVTGIVVGRTGSGEGVFLHFQDFGDLTGRFEVFSSAREADAFLRPLGLCIQAPGRGSAGGAAPAYGSEFVVRPAADSPAPPQPAPRRFFGR